MANLVIEVQQPSVELPVESNDASGVSQKLMVGFKRYKTEAGRLKIKEYEEIVNASDFDMMDSPELDGFIKEEILYLRKVALPVADADTGIKQVIKVPDTRTAKKVETLWEDSEECLAVLLDAYFQWTSWRVSFIQQVQSALLDTDYQGALRKNF